MIAFFLFLAALLIEIISLCTALLPSALLLIVLISFINDLIRRFNPNDKDPEA